MDVKYRKVGAASGIAACISFAILYLVAMSLDTVYVFGKNYLSDLGVREGAWAFNSSLIIAGLLFLAYDLLGVGAILGKQPIDRAALGMLIVGALFLISIGVFTEDAGDIHGIVSYGFFLSMLIALALVAVCMYRSKYLGRLGYMTPLVLLAVGVLILPMGGTPLVETIAVLGILAWGLVSSISLLLKEFGVVIP